MFKTVSLQTNVALLANKIYTISVDNVIDCKSNRILKSNIKIAIPQDAAIHDIAINEILFNPKPNGYDYVEFYNNTNKVFDLSKLYIANRNSSQVISSITQISNTPKYFYPGDYIAITEDAASLGLHYFAKNPKNIITISSLPSYSDDEGNVLLLNGQGLIVDAVSYKDDWHFKLITNDEGISLERLSFMDTAQKASNWHSAASTAGFGTPGYKNSQYLQTDFNSGTIEVLPKIFSPDNDGRDDIATIYYEMETAGFVANIVIYDASARPVRYLVKNGSLGLKGSWNWDGLNDKGNKLPIGNYIVHTEIFNLNGKKKQFKTVVSLARVLR